MYFSNLFNSVYKSDRGGRKGTIPFECSISEKVSPDTHVVLEDNKICLKHDISDKNNDLFLFGLNPEDMNTKVLGEKSRLSLTYNDIKDTDENPLIVVLAKSIKFYAGVSTYIKYINIGKDVLAMLVFGACEFTFPDGTSVAMQRCNSSYLEERIKFEYTGEDLSKTSILEDKESGYRYNNEAVNSVIVSYTSSKGTAFDGVKYRTVLNHVNVFDSSKLEEAREKANKRKKLLEQEKQRKLEERKKAEERARLKAIKEEKNKQEKVNKQFKSNNHETVEIPTSGRVNNGALAFMNAIKNL